MVELANVGVDICTCFREPVPLDCYWEGECGLFSWGAIGVKVRDCRFVDHMDFFYFGWLVFLSLGFDDCHLHSLHLASIIFQIDGVAMATILLILFGDRSWV